MQFTTTATLATAILAQWALAAPVSSPKTIVRRDAGSVTIHNQCSYDIDMQPINQVNGYTAEAVSTIAAGTNWTAPQEAWSTPLVCDLSTTVDRVR